MMFSKRAREALLAYAWPGNIRELENEVERAVALSYTDEIQLDDLSREVRRAGTAASGEGTPKVEAGRLKQMELGAIEACLAECGGNRTRAAKLLGISRESLRRKLKPAAGEGDTPDNTPN